MPPEFKYFTAEEVVGLDTEFVSKLDLATAKTAEISVEKRRIPFVITSGFRTPEKNISIIGSVPDSSHLTGKAVDLLVASSHEVWVMVAALRDVGINRVGIYVDTNSQVTHLHADCDTEKVDQVLFIKREGQANSVVATV